MPACVDGIFTTVTDLSRICQIKDYSYMEAEKDHICKYALMTISQVDLVCYLEKTQGITFLAEMTYSRLNSICMSAWHS